MIKKTGFLLILIAIAIFHVSCKEKDDKTVTSPFDSMSVSDNVDRDKIVIMSDIHLGNDLSYSENVKHLQRMEQFLNEVRASATVKELVLNGDVFDEWYIPTRSDTYSGGTQADFVNKTVAANQSIFNVLNAIIKDGNIKVTYVPGNHDMGFTPENIDLALPGVNQARDPEGKYPVGTYHPDNYPQIAIEHGHRYDFFCAMTPNEIDDAPESIMPPGYFFARIAANSFTDPTTEAEATKVHQVVLNDPANQEQNSKFNYYKLWYQILTGLIYVKDDFNEPIFTTNIGGLTNKYSINDILPKNETDGSIQMQLYNNMFTQAKWDERQRYNNVYALANIDTAMYGSLKTIFIDERANAQYFQNPKSDVRIAIFGHTHGPKIMEYTNTKGQKCLYANSGTWEDEKSRDKNSAIDQDVHNMDFITIVPVKSDKKKLQLARYQYHKGTHVMRDSQEIDL